MAGPTAYLFDLDGTLADLTHRLHHIQSDPKNWDAFFAACVDDEPIQHVAEIARALMRYHRIVIVSGRSDQVRSETVRWLNDHHIPYWSIYMRKAGDHRADHVIKKELFDEIRQAYDIQAVFDDRQQVVDMWRSEGIPCLQVAAGNF